LIVTDRVRGEIDAYLRQGKKKTFIIKKIMQAFSGPYAQDPQRYVANLKDVKKEVERQQEISDGH